MKVIGVRNIDYKRKTDGQQISGIEVHFVFDRKDMLDGVACDKQFIGSGVIEKMNGEIPRVGSNVEFTYNRFGKVAGWIVK